jgi:hypothetical protein
MNWTTELPFILNGVEGDLKIVYTPMGQKFYQNGREIKRNGLGFGGQKYKVVTTDGGDSIVTVKGNLKKGRQVVFRGETTDLETPLSGMAMLLAFLPFITVVVVAAVIMGAGIGIIGGALLGATGALGTMVAGNLLRNEPDTTRQILYSIITSLVAAVVLFVLLLIFSFIFGMIFGIAFSFF